MRARALALAAFEVAVRRRGHALAFPGCLAVHADTHGAARLAPFEAGVAEHAVEAFRLGRALDEPGARDDPGGHDGAPAPRHPGGGAPVLQATVRAGAAEDARHGDARERQGARQAHVGPRPGEALPPRRIAPPPRIPP